MKRVFVTAGAVYGYLDDNKLITNRSRGIWATKFAEWLHQYFGDNGKYGYEVTLLVPDLMHYQSVSNLRVVTHKGYEDYRRICYEEANQQDAAVMAAAVLNWLPAHPYKGKMPTDGVPGESTIDIKFLLTERVIDKMRVLNPGLTLIGCKLTSGSTKEHTIAAAYKTLIGSKANVVVANDLSDLKLKTLVYPDGSNFDYQISDFYGELKQVIDDEHYQTISVSNRSLPTTKELSKTKELFDAIVNKHRSHFVKRLDGKDRVFGSVAVDINAEWALVSPREKGGMFSANEAVLVYRSVSDYSRIVETAGGKKASLNAPLLVRHLNHWPGERYAVLHLHEQLPGAPTESYAPPGTLRDNNRNFSDKTYNIIGHGFISLIES